MKIPVAYAQKCKIVFHIAQGILIFFAWCLTIAVFTKGHTDGRTAWYFGLCFLTVPALLYLAMVPRWSRTVRFVNAYAFASVDILFTVLWFSAFIAVGTWNGAGIAAGKEKFKDDKDKAGKTGCEVFAYGTEGQCSLSKATVGLGVVIFLLFGLTSAISVYYVNYYRKNGHLPDAKPEKPSPSAIEAQTKDAWSTEPDDFDVPAHRSDRQGEQEEDEHALLHGADTMDGHHPGRPVSWGSQEHVNEYGQNETGYHGVGARYENDAPSALSPGGYDDDGRGRYHEDFSYSRTGR